MLIIFRCFVSSFKYLSSKENHKDDSFLYWNCGFCRNTIPSKFIFFTVFIKRGHTIFPIWSFGCFALRKRWDIIPSKFSLCSILRMYTGLVFLVLRTFRAGQRLLPRDLTGNRIPAIILSLSRKPGPGFSKIRHLLFDSRFTSGRRKEYGLFFTFQRSS